MALSSLLHCSTMTMMSSCSLLLLLIMGLSPVAMTRLTDRWQFTHSSQDHHHSFLTFVAKKTSGCYKRQLWLNWQLILVILLCPCSCYKGSFWLLQSAKGVGSLLGFHQHTSIGILVSVYWYRYIYWYLYTGIGVLVSVYWFRYTGIGILVSVYWYRYTGIGILVSVYWYRYTGIGILVSVYWYSLVPSPTPSFSSLLSTVLSSDEKLGVGLGTRLILVSVYWYRYTGIGKLVSVY